MESKELFVDTELLSGIELYATLIVERLVLGVYVYTDAKIALVNKRSDNIRANQMESILDYFQPFDDFYHCQVAGRSLVLSTDSEYDPGYCEDIEGKHPGPITLSFDGLDIVGSFIDHPRFYGGKYLREDIQGVKYQADGMCEVRHWNCDKHPDKYPDTWVASNSAKKMLEYGKELASSGKTHKEVAIELHLLPGDDHEARTKNTKGEEVDVKGILAEIFDIPSPMIDLEESMHTSEIGTKAKELYNLLHDYADEMINDGHKAKEIATVIRHKINSTKYEDLQELSSIIAAEGDLMSSYLSDFVEL